MNATLFVLFLITSATTIVTPGPGVLMVIMKSLQHGFRGAIWTICGTSSGSVVLAIISGTGVGVVLAHSPTAYAALRIVGACYLVWLGVRSWRLRAQPDVVGSVSFSESAPRAASGSKGEVRRFKAFLEGITLQLTNPVLIMFFISLFPQFIDQRLPYAEQYAVLTLVYFVLVFSIHCGYAMLTTKCRRFLSGNSTLVMHRIGGTLFLALSVMVFYDVLFCE